MGILWLPPQKYVCSKCGSEKCHEFTRSAKPERPGTYEGVICEDCGHKMEHYKQTIWEMEMGGGGMYTYNPNKPQPF